MDEPFPRLLESRADYGDWAGEYRALVDRCALALRNDRRIVRLRGPRRAEMLNGLVTNRVTGLETAGRHAMLLTAKGRVLTDLRVFPFGDVMLLDVPEAGLLNLLTAFKKYLPPVHATFEDASHSLSLVGVYGPEAYQAVAAVLGDEVPAEHLEVAGLDMEGVAVLLARNRRLAGDGVEIVVPRETAAAVAQHLLAGVRERGGRIAGSHALEAVRVECAIPRYGHDISEANLAQETGLEVEAISYDKGCYLGQEVVARIHFRGHVNRRLSGLKFGTGLPANGTVLCRDDGKQVGLVTSAVESPDYGAIGLGYVQREVGAGTELRWTDGDREAAGTVVDLPFRASPV